MDGHCLIEEDGCTEITCTCACSECAEVPEDTAVDNGLSFDDIDML